MLLSDKIFQCSSLRPKACENCKNFTLYRYCKYCFSIVFFLPKFYCNIMSIRETNLNKEPKPNIKYIL